jgi:hypothetical protein
MNIVAIDFSLNSPGIVISKKDSVHFISYIKDGIGTKAETKMNEELALCKDISFKIQPTFTTSKDFSEKEISKLQRFITMAKDMIEMIQPHIDLNEPIEGVSYGSGGGGTNNLIDLAAAAAIFKYSLLLYYRDYKVNIVTVAPTTIKKHAGNGRLKKRELWDVFVENQLNDSLLNENSVWGFANNLKIGAKVPKPFDDIIDAYFLASYLRAL